MLLLQRVLSPVVEVREEESAGVLLMFAYSFLAMTAYNILKPVTRSKFISALGADNLPYVLLAAGLMIGVLMTGYSWLVARLPRRGALPITQVGMAGLLFLFWGLFQTETRWASPAFYLLGLILGVLLISQFWTVANIVYDPRQAKRVFGFIGGGASLGGMAGSYILQSFTPRLGTTNMLVISGAMLLACAVLVWHILPKAHADTAAAVAVQNDEGVSSAEGFALLRSSTHLKIIALVISFAAVGAAIIEQQLNMAAEAAKGANQTDAITVFLAQIQLWTSTVGFVIQIWLTSRIHRYLGIGFALMVLPVSLGAGAVVTLLNAALWAPGLARVLDQSLRYTVDKTTREILFLPLPGEVTLKAKSFVDVTVDRMAKAVGALLLLVLVQPWGLNLDWQQLSYASLAVMGLWFFMSVTARRGYLHAFRQSIGRRDIDPAHVRLTGADLSTVETLVHELASPHPARVIYAIDMLQTLGAGNLVTPLLLRHESAQVRERSLSAIGATQHENAAAWTPHVRHALADPDASVRAAALVALGAISHEDAASLARPMLADPDPRIRATAAVALASSSDPADLDAAEATLSTIVSDSTPATQAARHDVAAALEHTGGARFQRLLIVLLYDPAREVADRAMGSVRTLGSTDFMFVPTLVSLLRNRQLKGRARDALVSYGEPVIDSLAYFMADPHEDEWVRRHLPSTLAAIPSQRTVDVLVGHLNDPDRFVRYKVVHALTRLRRADDRLRFPADVLARKVIEECRQFFRYLSLHGNLSSAGVLPDDTLLAMALQQKRSRGRQRIFHLLGLTYAAEDIAAAEWTLTHGEPRTRASASEYLDNLLTGQVRKMVLPVVEDLPEDERVGRGNVLIGSRRRDVEDTLLHLINDEDQVISACAIEWVRQQRRWNLAPDIEHVLAHREARDWFVFEAASLALAEHRLQPDHRRRAWIEPLPAVVL
ncbi:MAG: HEAT repeat domain-containing protein, partial [Acidobacteria bacterium]|nr:HEAT repeat domain-containing protein [Acidobacteriota bacterium]